MSLKNIIYLKELLHQSVFAQQIGPENTAKQLYLVLTQNLAKIVENALVICAIVLKILPDQCVKFFVN